MKEGLRRFDPRNPREMGSWAIEINLTPVRHLYHKEVVPASWRERAPVFTGRSLSLDATAKPSRKTSTRNTGRHGYAEATVLSAPLAPPCLRSFLGR